MKFSLDSIRKELAKKSTEECIFYLEDLLIQFDQETNRNPGKLARSFLSIEENSILGLIFTVKGITNPQKETERSLNICSEHRGILAAELQRYKLKQTQEKIVWKGEKQDFAFLMAVLRGKGVLSASNQQLIKHFTSLKGDFTENSLNASVSQLRAQYSANKLPKWLKILSEIDFD